MFLFLGIFWLMVSLTRFFEWYHFCHSMNGTNHTKITMHRCIWQALSYLNNYISFRNIYNTNILFNKKNEYLYNINCLLVARMIIFICYFIYFLCAYADTIVECSDEFRFRIINIAVNCHIFIKSELFTLSNKSSVAIISSYVLK